MKNTIILAISIVAITISLISISKPLLSASQANSQPYNGETREFWLFNSNIPDFNETEMNMPHDVYSMPTISVFKGDTVLIHFFNTEEAGGDHHSFTIKDPPYNINVELSPGENRTISFSANSTGIFNYYCTFHQPTMRGQLIVKSPLNMPSR
jgi:plastocyanin